MRRNAQETHALDQLPSQHTPGPCHLLQYSPSTRSLMMAGTVTRAQPSQAVAPSPTHKGAGLADTSAGAPDALAAGGAASSAARVSLSGGVSVASPYEMNVPPCARGSMCSGEQAGQQAQCWACSGTAQPCAPEGCRRPPAGEMQPALTSFCLFRINTVGAQYVLSGSGLVVYRQDRI